MQNICYDTYVKYQPLVSEIKIVNVLLKIKKQKIESC